MEPSSSPYQVRIKLGNSSQLIDLLTKVGVMIARKKLVSKAMNLDAVSRWHHALGSIDYHKINGYWFLSYPVNTQPKNKTPSIWRFCDVFTWLRRQLNINLTLCVYRLSTHYYTYNYICCVLIARKKDKCEHEGKNTNICTQHPR